MQLFSQCNKIAVLWLTDCLLCQTLIVARWPCIFLLFLSYCLILFLPSVLWRCWLGGRKGIRPVKKTEWWGAGVVICLERGADLHMPIWCHCHSLSLASVKSRLVLPFWYRPTRVVLEKGSLNGCVCVCLILFNSQFLWHWIAYSVLMCVKKLLTHSLTGCHNNSNSNTICIAPKGCNWGQKAWEKRSVVSLDLNKVTESLLRTVYGSEFQTAGAEHGKVRFTWQSLFRQSVEVTLNHRVSHAWQSVMPSTDSGGPTSTWSNSTWLPCCLMLWSCSS